MSEGPIKRLYYVHLVGMHRSMQSETSYGDTYVVATGPTEAYQKLRDFLDKNNLGFGYEREMANIELLAEWDRYTNCGHILLGVD